MKKGWSKKMKGKSKKVIAVSFVAIMVMMAFLGVVSAVTIEHHTLCKGTEDSIVTVHGSTGHALSPVNETTEFYVTDSRAVCLVQIERINRDDTFRFEWYDPSDLLYQVDNSSTNPYFGCWFGVYSDRKTSYLDAQGYIVLRAGTVDVSPPQLGWGTCWLPRSLKIDGNPPASKIGNWHVDFYYNDEKQFTETFTISDSIPESGAPTSGRWIGTTSQGKDVAFNVSDTQVNNFSISYSYSCSGSHGLRTIKLCDPQIDIIENKFQFDTFDMKLYGEFTSPNFATGTYRETWRDWTSPGMVTCDSGNITWSARRVQITGDINVTINEIMYNPPGADTDHEWLELYNNDTTDIDITGWCFYEAGINHSLTLIQGSMVIPSGGYAIIADNATTFLDEHQECNCTVIDSAFSLNNSGEYIALKNATLGIIDEVAYNASWGADGNGRTLELNATRGWEESRVDGGTPCQQNSVLAVFEYTFEDFNDMITVIDTGFNDFSGNMGIVNKDGVPYIEAPLNISSLSQDEPGGSLRISYDFTKGDDEEAFAGIFMSLFGLTETQGTFDGETVEVIDFSNYTIDFKNIFGELQETPKDFEYVRFYVKGVPATEDKIILHTATD